MNQPSLFPDDDDSLLEQRFQEFAAAHPDVERHLVDVCRRWRNRGGGEWSIKAAWEIIRWEHLFKGLPDPAETYKLNNSYTSRYARRIMRRCPELAGLFELRELRS